MMSWSEDGDVSVRHPRVPWGGLITDDIVIHCQLERLKGTASSLGRQAPAQAAAYQGAKSKFNLGAALDLVERCVSGDALDRLADVVVQCEAVPILILPHPPFDDEQGIGHQHAHVTSKPTNALPFAYASYLAQTLGGIVDGEIVQAARVGRTRLNRWLRFLCQPSFCGRVSTDRPYIIVDDVVSTGGTFAALRSYIVANGGHVVATTSIADSQGRDRPLPLARDTLDMLLSAYGSSVDVFWEGTIGHGIRCLTEWEAQFLIQWARDQPGWCPGNEGIQRLRDRLNQAAATGR